MSPLEVDSLVIDDSPLTNGDPAVADDRVLGGPAAGALDDDRALLLIRRCGRILRDADGVVADRRPRWSHIPCRVTPDADRARNQTTHDEQPGWPAPDALVTIRRVHEEAVRRLFARLFSAAPADAQDAVHVIDHLMRLFARHPRRFAQIAAPSGHREGMAARAVRVAALSAAVATRLGWSPADIRIAGLTGLLCDVGMGAFPLRVLDEPRPSDEAEINLIRRHCGASVALLESLQGLPDEVRLAVWQHHEQDDARGYPCAQPRDRIHDAARITAAADRYIALREDRADRPPLPGAEAIVHLLHLAHDGVLYAPAVRALVQVVGLHPVGTWVHTSDGGTAEVIGATPAAPGRPLIRRTTGEVIDLAHEDWATLTISAWAR